MKKDEAFFLKVFAAALPLLGRSLDFESSFFMGALVAAALGISAGLFWLTWFHSSKVLRELLLFILIGAAVGASQLVCAVTPWWGISLWLLLMPVRDGARVERPRFPEIFRLGISFWMLLAYLGIFQEILGHHFQVLVFTQPAGSLFLLALAGAFLKFRPAAGEKFA